MSAIKVVVFLADGFEEVEAVTPVDYLRRAGIDVLVAGVETLQPKGAHGLTIQAEVTVSEIDFIPAGVILPGGMPGSANLAASEAVRGLCLQTMDSGGLVASLCAAPALALGTFGLLDGRRFTCYPGFEENVVGGEFAEDRVVTDSNLITSRGPGTAGEFSIELIRYLTGDDEAATIAGGTLIRL